VTSAGLFRDAALLSMATAISQQVAANGIDQTRNPLGMDANVLDESLWNDLLIGQSGVSHSRLDVLDGILGPKRSQRGSQCNALFEPALFRAIEFAVQLRLAGHGYLKQSTVPVFRSRSSSSSSHSGL
jgi:hypothetical protein